MSIISEEDRSIEDVVYLTRTHKVDISDDKLFEIICKYKGKFYDVFYFLDLVEEYQKLKEGDPRKELLLELILYEVEK